MKTLRNVRRLKTRWVAAAAALVCLTAAVPRAQAAGLLIADGGFGGRLKIQEHSVHVTINNGIAVTEVTQVFENLENRQVEALYTFPVPAMASVSNFSMWIDGKEMIGEVVEKERAREIYNSYKRQRRDPGLLEQVDFKTFEMRIFPIAPRATQRVKIEYYQELDFDNDWATFVYPLATVGNEGVDTTVEGKFSLTLDVKSEVPIVKLESPSHGDAFVVVKHSDHYVQASLEQSMGSLSRDFVLAYQASRPLTGVDLITSKEAGGDGYFLMTLTPGEELSGDAGGMDYLFILDISGSMASDGKLQASSESVGAFIEALGPNDRFELITFNVNPNTLFNELVGVSDGTMAEAGIFLRSQQARGGTVLDSALRAAFNYADPSGDRQLNLVILSDGLTDPGDRRALLDLVSSRPDSIRIFCVGVGNEVNRPLLRQLAREAGGLAAFISRGDDFARQAAAFRRKLTRPVATNLRFDFSGVEVYDVEPRKLPNLYHGMPVRVFGRYKGSGPLAVRVQADLQGFDLNQELEFNAPKTDDQNPEIERMWAWHRVQRLANEAAGHGGARPGTKTHNEIVALGEAYSIVTEYTSFLVLENDAEYRRWKIDRRNRERIKRDRKARRERKSELDVIRKRAAADLGPGAARERLAKAPEQGDPSKRNFGTNPRPSSPDRNRRDLAVPRRSTGGGAFDPVTGLLAVGAAASALAYRRRNR